MLMRPRHSPLLFDMGLPRDSITHVDLKIKVNTLRG